jgi:hypothetical protein
VGANVESELEAGIFIYTFALSKDRKRFQQIGKTMKEREKNSINNKKLRL